MVCGAWKGTAADRRYPLVDGEELVCEPANLYGAQGQRMFGLIPRRLVTRGQRGYHMDTETGLLLLTHRY